ncbi:MAG: hypothetical protein JO208_01615 [Alphaproteobacteria bacterium]|nr:hypothetical protein [Alphaproteobacteria bacterium]
MSDATWPMPASSIPERRIFEQALYANSPFGTLATTLLVLLVLVGALLMAALADHYPPVVHTTGGWTLGASTWPGIVLSILVTVALGMQRYVRNRDVAENLALQAVMPDCQEGERRIYDAAGMRRLKIASAVGALLGALPSVVLVPHALILRAPATFAWFIVMDAFTAALFARGIVQSTRAAESWARLINQSLIIDLLRIDSLNVIGRYAARTALIWFSVAGAILLFFVGHNMNMLTFAVLLLAAVMGVWIFVRPMERVHRRIRAAKRAELEPIRQAIESAWERAPHDALEAAKLQGLLALESRIEAVREWPFDQPTALRVAAYVLIPAVPWFGQAIAGYFVANFVHAKS